MKKKMILIPALVLGLTLMLSSVCFAEGVTFVKVLVDSNSFSTIAVARKNQTTPTAYFYIGNIYKADGAESNYRRIKVRVTNEGETYTVEKGRSYNLPIPEDYQTAGMDVAVYGMGNNSALDCKVSGRWDVH